MREREREGRREGGMEGGREDGERKRGDGEGEEEGGREKEGDEKVETCYESEPAPPDDLAHAHLCENSYILVYGGISYFLPPFF